MNMTRIRTSRIARFGAALIFAAPLAAPLAQQPAGQPQPPSTTQMVLKGKAPVSNELLKVTLPVIKPGVVAAALFGFIISFGNLEMTLFLVAPGQTTLPIAILQYLQWRIDPTIAAVSLLQIVLIGAGMLVTDRYVKLTRVL